MIVKTLYKRNLKGEVVVWKIATSQSHIGYNISYGKADGELITRRYHCNRNDIDQQILSRYELKCSQGYKIPPSDWDYKSFDWLPIYNTDKNNRIKPMKAGTYEDRLFRSEMIGQGKVNGVRAMVMYEESVSTELFDKPSPVKIISKNGIEYNIKHIQQHFEDHIFSNVEYRDIVFDGEIYIPNEVVTTIGGAARNKNNPKHNDLVFIIFDVAIEGISQIERISILDEISILDHVFDHNENTNINNSDYPIQLLYSKIIYTIDDVKHFTLNRIENGFEGCVLRDLKAEYKFGQRSITMLKCKQFKDSEFKILDIKLIHNTNDNIGVSLIYILKNDITKDTFEASGIGTVQEKYNIFAEKDKYIGKYATVKYYERTINKLPFHANVIAIRNYE